MAYNRGRESSLASMGKEKEEGKGKDPWPGEPLDLEQLSDASNAENAIIKLKDDPAFTLNQTEIDYSMLFRVKELDFINAVRQVYDIKAGSHAERDPDDPLTFREIMSNYYKGDRIAPRVHARHRLRRGGVDVPAVHGGHVHRQPVQEVRGTRRDAPA